MRTSNIALKPTERVITENVPTQWILLLMQAAIMAAAAAQTVMRTLEQAAR